MNSTRSLTKRLPTLPRRGWGRVLLLAFLSLIPWLTETSRSCGQDVPRESASSNASNPLVPTPSLSDVGLPNPNNHDRLFHALHGAQILAESGAGYEAARVIAAIAMRPNGGPPAEAASRRLKQWGLSVEQVEQLTATEINRQVGLRISQQQTTQPHVLHLNNLIDLGLVSEAIGYLMSAVNDCSADEFNEQWSDYLRQHGIDGAGGNKNLSVESASDFVKSIAQDRQLWRSIQRLWFVDHASSEMALQLWRHRQGSESDSHFPFPHDHHRPWEEVLNHALELARSLEKEKPDASRTLAVLIINAAPESEQARLASTLAIDLPGMEKRRSTEPTASKVVDESFRQPDPKWQLGDDLFESTAILDYRLELDERSLERLRMEPREYVSATFYHGEDAYPEVGVRIKGGAGSFREFDGQSKIGLTVKFNQFVKKQRFHGLRRIVLNNAVQDPSYLNEYLGYGLFREAGIPAPRVTHATLTINGEAYGLYVQAEAATKDFLKAWFSKDGGNLYEGPGDVLNWEGLDLDTNQDKEDRRDLRRLVEAIEQADDQDPWPALARHVDVFSFAKFVAMEQLVGHWDGFSACNNYRIYYSPDVEKFYWIPHGADQLFADINRPIFDRQESILGRALLQTSSGRQIYTKAVDLVLNQYWNEQKLLTQIRETYVRLLPVIQSRMGKGHNFEVEFEQRISKMIEFIELRRSVVVAQLQNETPDNWRQRRGHVGFPSFLRMP